MPFTLDHAILLSTQDVYDPSKALVTHVAPLTADLNPGEASEVLSVTVNIPAGVSGSRYVIVCPDPKQQTPFNTAAASVEINVPPVLPADLVIDNVSVPAAAVSGQPISVSWSVRNAVNIPTLVSAWTDKVVLSNDDDLTTQADNVELGTISHSGVLDFDQTYVASLTANLPNDATGPYYLFVTTDASDLVFEGDGESNNSSTGYPISVDYRPADLQAQDVTVLSDGEPISAVPSGSTVTVSAEVANCGSGATAAGSWTDKIYLTKDGTVDGSSRLLAEVPHSGAVAAGESYPISQEVTIPADWSQASASIVIDVDAGKQVYESDDNNNRTSCPVVTHYAPADLQVQSVTVMSDGQPVGSVYSGSTIKVDWTVVNAGGNPSSADAWFDAIYISDSSTFDAQARRLAAVRHSGGLDSHAAYSASRDITIPLDFAAGTAYVYICTDTAGQVYELDDSNNAGSNADPFQVSPGTADLVVSEVTVLSNGVPAVTVTSGSKVTVRWTVRNEGPAVTSVGYWRDRICISPNTVPGPGDPELAAVSHGGTLGAGEEYTAEQQVEVPINVTGDALRVFLRTDSAAVVYESDRDNNAIAGSPFKIVWGPPDLTVENVSAVRGGPDGQAADVTWTVRNNGGPTGLAQWSDAIYLSDGHTIGSGAVEMATAPHTGALGYNETYTFTATVHPTSGTGYLIVQADADAAVPEQDAINNTAYTALPVLGSNSDLVVSNVDAPATAIAGQTIQVRWTVENRGSSATNVPAWNDAIYLSRDKYLDRGSDTYLGYLRRSTAPVHGDAYTASVDVRIPGDLSGPYYMFAVADTSSNVGEKDETNNEALDSQPVDLVLPPPTDLLVSSIDVPSAGTVGSPVTISWTVHNAGGADAQGSWNDSAYLSSDTKWDLADKKIGLVRHSGTVAGGADYTATLAAVVPPAVPGEYHIIVRPDIHNEVRESNEGELNNITASANLISLSCWRADVRRTGQLAQSSYRYRALLQDQHGRRRGPAGQPRLRVRRGQYGTLRTL